MRLVIHDYGGYAFILQLSRELARRGHEILHLYAEFNPTPKGMLHRLEGDPDSFHLSGLQLGHQFRKYSLVRRWLQERQYGRVLAAATRDFDPEIVISANAPLDAQSILQTMCLRQHIKFVYWIQDLIGLATQRILSQRLGLPGKLIGRYYSKLEAQTLRRSDQIVTISDHYIPILSAMGVDRSVVEVIPNWAALDQIPELPKKNPWSIENNLENKFVFMYSGTLAFKHNVDLLIQLAEHFSGEREVRVVVVSSGPGAENLAALTRRQSIENLIQFPFQPMSRFPEVLASADVLIGLLTADAGDYSVPSKVLSYLCAGRPILLSIPAANPAAALVVQEKVGFTAEPGRDHDFLSKAARLRVDGSLRLAMGARARAYAEQRYNIGHIADQFDELLDDL